MPIRQSQSVAYFHNRMNSGLSDMFVRRKRVPPGGGPRRMHQTRPPKRPNCDVYFFAGAILGVAAAAFFAAFFFAAFFLATFFLATFFVATFFMVWAAAVLAVGFFAAPCAETGALTIAARLRAQRRAVRIDLRVFKDASSLCCKRRLEI